MLVENFQILIDGANITGMTKLGGLITDFMDRYHLSKAKAAKVLGASENGLSSLITGINLNTKKPIRPTEGTLRKLAERMTTFGYAMSFEQILAAAQEDAGEMVTDVGANEASQPRAIDAYARPVPGGPPLRDLTPKEAKLVKAIKVLADDDLDSVDLGPTSYVWALPPAARLRHLIAAVQDLGDDAGGQLSREG